MKNGKTKLAILVSRAVTAVLISCVCFLAGEAQDNRLKPKVEPSDRYGVGGTKETIIVTDGKRTTVTVVFKDSKGIVKANNQTITEPDDSYGKGGTNEKISEEIEAANGTIQTSEVEIIRDSQKRVREKRTKMEDHTNGVTEERFETRYCNGKTKYEKSVRRNSQFDELERSEAGYDENGKQISGFKMFFDENGNKKMWQFDFKTGKYKNIDTPQLPVETSSPPADTTACSNAFKRNEIFGGFSIIREDSEPERFNLNGVNASYTHYLNGRVGLTGDFNAHFRERNGVDLSKYSFLGGITVLPFKGATTEDRATVFTHALFGVSRFKADFGADRFTDNSFTMRLGGGLDVNVNNNFFIRPVRVDYAPIFGDSTRHNFQVGFGAGFRF
ncbi:MAG TPA: hypothetical protein VGJ55_04245 [Pyrinomonadaceae bacterium]